MDNEDANWIKDNVNDNIVEESGEFEGELFLSTDGKNTVHIKASTKEGRKAGLSWAKAVYDRLRNTYGTKQAQAKRDYETDDLGKCPKCQAPMKMSSKNKPYCSQLCWKV